MLATAGAPVDDVPEARCQPPEKYTSVRFDSR